MQLTTAQLQAIKADIAADGTLNSKPNNSDGNFEIAAIYNQAASPDFFVWKTSVTVTEIMQNGFDWTRVDNLTVGKARIWEFMTAIGTIRPNQANVRAGIEACFSVEVGDQTTRQAIYNHSVRLASRIEKLLATGSGTAPSHHGVGPATMESEGPISYSEIEQARMIP